MVQLDWKSEEMYYVSLFNDNSFMAALLLFVENFTQSQRSAGRVLLKGLHVAGCYFWPPTETNMKISFRCLAWKTVSELFTTGCLTLTTKTFHYYCYLEKRPPLTHRALLALMVIGSWSSSAPLSLAPLCSHCWRCHHQHSNKAKATSAFSASLFTLMTSCRSEHTLLFAYRTSCICTHGAGPRLKDFGHQTLTKSQFCRPATKRSHSTGDYLQHWRSIFM